MRGREAARLGFKRAIVPYRNVEKRPIEVDGIKIIPVKSVYEVIKELKGE
jgi:predicted ATP-dependent protease